MRRGLVTIAVLLSLCVPAGAQEAATVTETLRVPTVDGAEISVRVKRPASGRAPVVLNYSPYNVGSEAGERAFGDDRFVAQGYVRAIADVLGTNNSSGCWDYGGPKEQQSGVDLVNFLAAQPWSNGKVAMVGGSYDGATANMVAARSQDAPGLAAVVPEASVSNWYGYAYRAGVRYFLTSQSPGDQGFDTPLYFDFGWALAPPTEPQAIPGSVRPCDEVEHTQHGYDQSPDHDDFWKQRDYRKDASSFRVPVLLSHGWQDFNVKQEHGVGLYEALDRVPWKGIWLGQHGHATPEDPQWTKLVDQFLATYLWGRDSGLPPSGVVVSQPRDRAEAGAAERLESWPPPRTGDLELKLGRIEGAGMLGADGGDPISYVDDGLSEDQHAQAFTAETGFLTYVSEPAKEDVRIAGSPVLDATVTLDRDAGHLTPTLWEIAGDPAPGRRLEPITRGFLNLRYRDGLEKEKPVPAGEPVRAVVEMLPQDYILRAGHRLVLTVASSNTAWAVPAGQPGLGVTVAHGGASRLLVPVVGAGSAPAGRPPLPKGQRPAEILPTDRQARRKLRVTLRRGRRGTLLVTGRAPDRTSIFLRFTRGGRVYSDRSVRARKGRFTLRVKAKRPGVYRVTAMLRTREGVVSRKSARVRVR